MKFELDFKILVDEEPVESAALLAGLDGHRDKLTDVTAMEGVIVIRVDGAVQGDEVMDPIMRLTDQWVRKIPWMLTGDTETVAFRDSEHCYAFVPAGESIEFSFFSGSELEIEDYLIEPTNVRMEAFVNQTLNLGERLLDLVRALDASLLDTNEDCRELSSSLDEGRKAWHDYKLHQRR